jgi:hypothetical protein
VQAPNQKDTLIICVAYRKIFELRLWRALGNRTIQKVFILIPSTARLKQSIRMASQLPARGVGPVQCLQLPPPFTNHLIEAIAHGMCCQDMLQDMGFVKAMLCNPQKDEIAEG